MKKNFLTHSAAFLAATLIITSFPASAADSDKATEALTKKVDRVAVEAYEKNKTSDTFCYGFYDITGNGTKEVFVKHGENDVIWQIFRYETSTGKIKTIKFKNGSSIKTSLSAVNFVKKNGKKKLTVISGGIKNTEKITDYKYKDGILTATATYTYNTKTKAYKKDGKKIKAATYKKKLKAANKLKNVSCNNYSKAAYYKYVEDIYFKPALVESTIGKVLDDFSSIPGVYPTNQYDVTLYFNSPYSQPGDLLYTPVKTLTFKRGETRSDTVLGKFDLTKMELLPTEKYDYGDWFEAEDFFAFTTIDVSEADKIMPGFTIPLAEGESVSDYEIKGEYILPEGGPILSAEFYYCHKGESIYEGKSFARYEFKRA